MADDIPDLDLSNLNQPVNSPAVRPTLAAPVREVVAPLHSFHDSPLGTIPIGPIPQAAPVQAAAPAAPILEETIQIAPNPTTNRFPWTPVENPRVPIVQPIVEIPEVEPLPTPRPPVVAQPPAPAPAPLAPAPPEPITASVAAPQPVPPPAPEVVLPPPAPAPAPIPAPQPIQMMAEPVPEAEPSTAELPPTPPAPPLAHALSLTPPPPAPSLPVQPVAEPQQEPIPIPEAPAQPKPHSAHHPVRIYSDYTREAWHVFRPNNLIKVMVLCFVCALIGGAIAIWWISGAPTNFYDLPFLKTILHAE